VANGLEAGLGGRATINHSFVSGNSGSGLLASSGTSQIYAEGNQIAFNGTGVNASASGATIRLSDNNINNNTNGIAITAGATVFSANNNRVVANASTTAPNGVPAIPIQ
jgi:hypothetical protein